LKNAAILNVAAPLSRDVEGIRNRPERRVRRMNASCHLKRAVKESLEPSSRESTTELLTKELECRGREGAVESASIDGEIEKGDSVGRPAKKVMVRRGLAEGVRWVWGDARRKPEPGRFFEWCGLAVRRRRVS
jgi:hypothetical protein